MTFQDNIPGDRILPYFHLISGSFIVFYIPKLIFIIFNIFDDLIFQIRKMITIKKLQVDKTENAGKKITRRKLLTQVGIVSAGLPLLPLIYGIAHGRFDFTIRGLSLNFPNLPSSFNGIIFGLVPHEKIPTILSKTSVLVLPSYTEGLPTVCLEALASEVPIVASNVGGISEVVLDGETGYLVSQITPHLFAEKVLKLLANEPLRNKMGKRGRKLVEQFYNWNYVIEKTEKIYETIGELI